MNPRKGITDTADANSTQNTDQRSDLRTLDSHYSAREVYHTLECPYAGTEVLRTKEQQRAQASSERASARTNTSGGVTASEDRAGECGVSL